jgi:NAD(P)-dependent dehydrogenase (short-subunit alcohol dehydrogenase family)
MSATEPLRGRTALVTGAGSGIGLAIARGLAGAGAAVWIADSSEPALAAVADPDLTGRVCDVADPGAVAALFAEIGRGPGVLDILVNNAGVGGPAAPLEEVSVADWDRTLAVNLSGMFYCLREAVPAMKAAGRGAIVNISTASTRTGLPNRLPYVASKAGVEGLTCNVARELGPFGIRCNAILPGLVDNDRGRALVRRLAEREGLGLETAQTQFVSFVSMRTMIAMEEIADMAVFLASDAARHVTGQLIGVDGNLEWEA